MGSNIAYELIKQQRLEELDAEGILLKHRKTGANVLLISNGDDNKVFTIGFRTPAPNSTGLPHIMEHSVLCGSKLFPAKDPFVELAKGSLNTFLNAMTFPDKTLYPIASCNEKDFQNLMHVYLDAVFYPNIYRNDAIFRQEGWHYELESEEDELKINGVVYNEMRGAFSSPEGVLDREIIASLFPDTTYANESGGDPDVIPELSYEEFLDFHKNYYHPSNSYIYLYGNMDMDEKLDFLDKQYLSQFNKIEILSEIKKQDAFKEIPEIRKQYSITSDEPEEENTYLAYNMVVGTSLDRKLYLAFQVLEYALLSAPGAPLKQVLLDGKIGKDIMGSYDNGVIQPILSIIAKNSEVSKKDEFIRLIRDTLTSIIKNGIDHKSLKAGINYYEFKYREADFGSYPKGLIFGMQTFDSWLYDEKEPFLHIEANDTFAFLKNQMDTGYFEKLIEQYILNNQHASLVIIEPKKGLTAQKDSELKSKLFELKQKMNAEQLKKLVADTKALQEFQDTPSTKEELEAIPMLKRNDISKDAMPFQNEEKRIGDTLVLHHNLFTNGIAYIELLFDIKDVPEEWIPYIGILKSVLGYVNTEYYDYRELFNEINIHTGGIFSTLDIFTDLQKLDEPQNAKFGLKVKVLYENVEVAFSLLKEILFTSKFDDKKRLYEIIARLKSRLQMGLASSGHSTAVTRAMSYFSPSSRLSDRTSGIAFYQLIEKLEGNFEKEADQLIGVLKSLMKCIFNRNNLMISITSDSEGYRKANGEMKNFCGQLCSCVDSDKNVGSAHMDKEHKNEGFKTSSKVQYVARTGNFLAEGFEYTGALRILKAILNYDYLWINLRVKGGAYGCMSGFSRVGDSYLTSYRDPNLKNTNMIYEKTPDYIRNFDVDERDMTKYIIGAISEIDTPMNPAAKGSRSLAAYLNHLTYEAVQKERDEIINADIHAIRDLAALVESILRQDYICVLGSEEMIEKEREMFHEVKNLNS